MNLFPIELNSTGRLSEPAERKALLDEIDQFHIPEVLLFAGGPDTSPALLSEISEQLLWMPVAVLRWTSGLPLAASSLAALLSHLHSTRPWLRLHLAGSGAGAHIAATAAASMPNPWLESLTLIRAAFTPFAFAPQGPFRRILSAHLVRGPVAVTCSHRPAETGIGRTGAHGLAAGEFTTIAAHDTAALAGSLDYSVVNLAGETPDPLLAAILRSLCCREDTTPPRRRSAPVRHRVRTSTLHLAPTPALP